MYVIVTDNGKLQSTTRFITEASRAPSPKCQCQIADKCDRAAALTAVRSGSAPLDSAVIDGTQVDTVATTLTLAEQNHAEELKRVCLEFASRNLSTVMCSEGYHHMITSCPQLQVLTC